MVTMLSVFLLILLFLCSRSLNVPCSGPVTYDTSEFTIRGPCPNDVLIAPVGDTVQYRCDYEERASGVYLPYWHITELSDSPFRPDEQNDHQIIVELYILVVQKDTLHSVLQFWNSTWTNLSLFSVDFVLFQNAEMSHWVKM